MTLLQFANVDANYGAAKILHDVCFSIDAGERVALLGRNGVGKTTVLNALCGVATVTRGEIRFGGRSWTAPNAYDPARSGLGICPQGRRIVPSLTVEENLMLGATADRKGPWNVGAVFDLFPVLHERRTVRGTSLSGGQQQMLALGRALMSNPDLLILDEPSEGLAPVIIDDVARLLRDLGDRGTGIFLIEQNINLIRTVCDRCYVLSKGQVVQSGNLRDWTKKELQQHILV
jgi:ABC-type branched-subunit amino acid transport system ATPase component